MDKLEQQLFACWKVDATDTYKRHVMTELFKVIDKEPNQTTGRLFRELCKSLWNVTKVEFDCALASLRLFGVIGIHPVPVDETGTTSHVNKKRHKMRKWHKYQEYIQSLQPA